MKKIYLILTNSHLSLCETDTFFYKHLWHEKNYFEILPQKYVIIAKHHFTLKIKTF